MSDDPPIQYMPSQEAKDLHAKHTSQAWTDQQASSDALDNNLLKFSSAALGLSIGFIKNIVPIQNAIYLPLLYWSWALFGICILATIASFQLSILAQKAHFRNLNSYYLKGNLAALTKQSCWYQLLPWFSVGGILLLFSGVVLTICFTSFNIHHMKENFRCQTITKIAK
ncbi:MAG: hypothetical protein ABI147_09885 [Acidobacteriaceae bacterium]